jgi:hypothetical protein
MALERGKLSNVVRVSAGTTVGIITSTGSKKVYIKSIICVRYIPFFTLLSTNVFVRENYIYISCVCLSKNSKRSIFFKINRVLLTNYNN